MPKNCISCFEPLGKGGVCPLCGFDNAAYQPEPYHLPPETTLRGRYVIGKVMGEGGFGITYAGFDPVLRRKVAIKEFYPNGAVWRDPTRSLDVRCYSSNNYTETFRIGQEKCLQEAQSLARLDDIPAIVRIIDFFPENNTAYLVMEFVEGVTLREYARRQPERMTLPEILTLLAPVAEALEDVHRRSFVHRDVSPDNVMITPNGKAKLLDFGAVKQVTAEGNATKTPIVKRGFSPLELYSTAGLIGPWTDVYALAATVFFLLTGEPLDELANRLDNDTTAEKLNGVLPPAQADAMLHALAVQRQSRQQSVRGFVDELTAAGAQPAPIRTPEKAAEKTAMVFEEEPPRGEKPDEIAAKNDAIYEKATAMMSDTSVTKNEETILLFTSIIDWKDSREKIDECRQKINAINRAKEEKKPEPKPVRQDSPKDQTPKPEKKGKKPVLIGVSVVAALIVFAIVLNSVVIPGSRNKTAVLTDNDKYEETSTLTDSEKYEEALVLADSGEYNESIAAFEALGDYKDAKQKALETHYHAAVEAEQSGDTITAMLEYRKAGAYLDAAERAHDSVLSYQKSINGLVAPGSSHTVGLKADGTVVAVGDNEYGQCNVSKWTDTKAIAAGYNHTIGLKANGTVVATKFVKFDQDFGQCDVSGWTGIVAVDAGWYHTVGLKANGTVVATGDNDDGRCDVSGWTDIVAISTGYFHTVGLKEDGTVVATGKNHYGQCNVGKWTDIVAVDATQSCTIGLKADGTVVTTGKMGESCNVNGWKDIMAVAVGDLHVVGLKADGTVVATGDNYYGQCDVDGWTDIVSVSVEYDYTVGLKADGTVVATGENYYGQCDVSGWRNMMLPQDRT